MHFFPFCRGKIKKLFHEAFVDYLNAYLVPSEFTKSKNSPECFAPAGTHMVAPCRAGSVSPGDIHGYHW